MFRALICWLRGHRWRSLAEWAHTDGAGNPLYTDRGEFCRRCGALRRVRLSRGEVLTAVRERERRVYFGDDRTPGGGLFDEHELRTRR